MRAWAWAGSVALVLADSSIVTLALPDMLREFDATVFGISWVLTAFNVVLAAAVLPAARAAQGRPAATWAAGLAVFAAASLACAVAPSLAVVIAGRCAQALGGAAVVAGAIELLAGARGSHRAAAPGWGTAGVVGLAVGPAVGGALTELLSWQSIFALQVPAVLAAPAVLARPAIAVEPGSAGRVDLRPEIALGLLSAALTGALFLLVVMLIEGWRNGPLAAAAIVSVMPAATLAASALARRVGSGGPAIGGGAVAIAGGLAALGLLPGAAAGWTLAPQLLVGAGIALALPGLTDRALRGRDPQGRRAAATIAARHAGIVLGILLLTPIFSAELDDQHDAALRAGTALVLDAALSPQVKVAVGEAVSARVERAGGRLPRLSGALQTVAAPPQARPELRRLERALEEEVDKAATHAFSTSFLMAAALALLALAAIGWRGGR